MSVTIFQVAEARGVQRNDHGAVTMAEFMRVGLPIMGGCQVCGATIAAGNAAPSKSGYLRCASGCVGDDGFETVADFEAWCKEEDGE